MKLIESQMAIVNEFNDATFYFGLFSTPFLQTKKVRNGEESVLTSGLFRDSLNLNFF